MLKIKQEEEKESIDLVEMEYRSGDIMIKINGIGFIFLYPNGKYMIFDRCASTGKDGKWKK